MPRAGQFKPSTPTRLSDLVSIGVLTRVFPPGLVDEVIAATNKTEKRHRALPARTTAYFTLAMALHQDLGYADVLDKLTDGLSWAAGFDQLYAPPTPAAIVQARHRLGSAPMRLLFDRVAAAATASVDVPGDTPAANADMPGTVVAGKRAVAIDGFTVDVPDSEDNDAHFGRPGVSRGEKSAFPQARVVGLAECGTHVMCGARIGVYGDGEQDLAGELIDTLSPEMLLIADRGFFSYTLWRRAVTTGADLLFLLRTDARAPVPTFVRELADGSWLATMQGKSNAERKAADPFTVRVVDYHLSDGTDGTDGGAGDGVPESYRLITTVLDPEQASAEQLAEAYTLRWEIESVFDELKTHQRGPKVVLRSKSPTLVYQELYGHLCLYLAIRLLMGDVAAIGETDPRRLSFVAALRITRNTLEHPESFSPSRLGR